MLYEVITLGFVTALLLNQQFRWRTLARSLILIPWALPSVVIGLMWSWIYHPQVGLLNDLLLRVGMLNSAIPWLADPATALYSIIAALVWQGFPRIPSYTVCDTKLLRNPRQS